MSEVLRLAAFTTNPEGGNPAGVVLDAAGLSETEMLGLAAEVGYSETAFITHADLHASPVRLAVRYFSPELEVDFCGHATIATAVAWAGRLGPGELVLDTKAGAIDVSVSRDEEGFRAALTSVPTSIAEVPEAVLREVLAALGWSADELDPELPPKVAFGGVHHLVLAAGSRERLARLSYDFDRLRGLMEAAGWITLQLVYREARHLYHARDPFPVGGVVEDPATGAAAAAFGGYLRDLGELEAGEGLRIVQGEDMGRRSVLHVEAFEASRRIRVSGHACDLP